MIKAIIFDCFGVLIEDALGAMRDKIKDSEPEKYKEFVEILHAGHQGLMIPTEDNEQLAGLLGLSLAEYRRQIEEDEVKNMALLDYILQLRERYKTAILSNVSKGSLKMKFTDAELAKYFDAVVASGEVGYAKPEAQIYEIAADRLGVLLNECVFTDDNEDFCEAARGLGMQAIPYNSFEQFRRELELLLI